QSRHVVSRPKGETPMNRKNDDMPPDPLDDALGSSHDVLSVEIPPGVDRRTFLMRSAVIGATGVITGIPISAQERKARATAAPPPLSPDLDVVKKSKGPVLTTVDEFYKVGTC